MYTHHTTKVYEVYMNGEIKGDFSPFLLHLAFLFHAIVFSLRIDDDVIQWVYYGQFASSLIFESPLYHLCGLYYSLIRCVLPLHFDIVHAPWKQQPPFVLLAYHQVFGHVLGRQWLFQS